MYWLIGATKENTMSIEHLLAWKGVSYGYKATTATGAYIIVGDETKGYTVEFLPLGAISELKAGIGTQEAKAVAQAHYDAANLKT